MGNTLSRRRFMQMTGSALGVFAFSLVGMKGTDASTSQVVDSVPFTSIQGHMVSDIEKWLLSTGYDDIDAEIFTLLSEAEAPSFHNVFLPFVQR